ncbi:IS982 family transposase [Xenorhabdus griffiniae]|uniref:IS982 family transposase n=2 Tax=Xenorhabdus griffiniae TaxID=351672 RepID=A0ABY9XGM8_9GAMM|nr:IS982 family transposase [Xenorhabdus griffiniae]MBE8589446.1 IS982 family transposase [Xenorhabdus griffiniae]WMV70894.1 IS982 family transposase [Xenorhabdus griffiniae]WMV70997.1 IS982 family transposase [Xenorhabdus griffiniae]WMV71292.1 IS982 family transposase [Xenorhabdus griffiniae]WMV71482.1 IS982 family transposase [Xenorhabdus griffiniae]
MSQQDFIIWVFCWVDENLAELQQGTRFRSRGFPPKLSDAEAITMEVVGEFLGFSTDKGIWTYFRDHWSEWFPGLGSRANFAKQVSNLWAVKQQLQEKLARLLGALDRPVHIIDGFPLPVCLFKRAKGCARFKGQADYGYCATKSETYYGFKGHLLVDEIGIVTGFTLTPASVSEREAAGDLVAPITGYLLGDKGYLGTEFKQEMKRADIEMITPVRANMDDPVPKEIRKCINAKRRLIETVIGQLAGQFAIEKCWARDMWHLSNRIARKLLSHTLGIFANFKQGKKQRDWLQQTLVIGC